MTSCIFLMPGAVGEDQHACEVMIDFGGGDARWTAVDVEDGWNGFNATLAAAGQLDLEVNWTESSWGTSIQGFDGVMSGWPNETWALWLWNSTSSQWDLSPVGIDDVDPSEQEAIAWCYYLWGVEPLSTPDEKVPTIPVLFDFGDGNVHWADAPLAYGENGMNVTLAAAEALGFEADVDETYGFVNGFDGIMGAWPNEYWHLWLWNSSSGEWDMSMVGISSVDPVQYDAIGWSYVIDDPDTWACERPLATPDTQYPWVSLRHDLSNSGVNGIPSPMAGGIVWQTALGNGYVCCNIVGAEGKLYALTAGEYDWVTMDVISLPELFCLDSEGEVLWSVEYGEGGAGYETATPLLTDGKVIVPATNGKLYAFDSDSGEEIWNFTTHEAEGDFTGATTPALYRNQIIFGSDNGRVYSVSLDGEEVWNVTIASGIYFSAPAVRNDTVYIGSNDGKLHALGADGSGEMWNVTVKADGQVVSSPLVLDDQIVVTYKVGGMSVTDSGVVSYDLDGEFLWNASVGVVSSSPAISPSGIAVTSENGLTVFSPTGDVIWNADVMHPVKGSPCVGANGIYFNSYNAHGALYAVDFEGDVMWATLLEPSSDDAYSMCSPTLIDGLLYTANDDGIVYCIGSPYATFDMEVDGYGVTVDASDSVPLWGDLEFSWDFGDGATATGVTASHTYTSTGDHTIVLVVTENGIEGSCGDSFSLGPLADCQMTVDNDTVVFDASDSVSPAGNMTYLWEFGDGTNATGATVEHVYGEEGEHNVTLTVTDGDGNSDVFHTTVSTTLVEGDGGEGLPMVYIVGGVIVAVIAVAAIALARRR